MCLHWTHSPFQTFSLVPWCLTSPVLLPLWRLFISALGVLILRHGTASFSDPMSATLWSRAACRISPLVILRPHPTKKSQMPWFGPSPIRFPSHHLYFSQWYGGVWGIQLTIWIHRWPEPSLWFPGPSDVGVHPLRVSLHFPCHHCYQGLRIHPWIITNWPLPSQTAPSPSQT